MCARARTLGLPLGVGARICVIVRLIHTKQTEVALAGANVPGLK